MQMPPKLNFRNYDFRHSFLLCILIFLVSCQLFAEQLPIRTYSSADGMASSVIHHIARDSKGFLWFCARGGLSRFDGYEFINYKLPDDKNFGLVHSFLETHDGTYWISTDSGLYRVKPEEKNGAQPLKTEFRQGERQLNAKRVSNFGFFNLFEDKKGNLWGGGDNLYLIENREADEVSFKEFNFYPDGKKKSQTISDFAEAADGSVWGGFSFGLFRILPDGRVFSYQVPFKESSRESYNLMIDAGGRIWFSHSTGVFIFQPDSIENLTNQPDNSVFPLEFTAQKINISGTIKFPTDARQLVKLNVPLKRNESKDNREIQEIFQMRDGKILLPFKDSLYFFTGENYAGLTDPTALSGQVRSIVEDTGGNIWLGSFGGVAKFSQSGLISYTQNTGLTEPIIHLVQENANRELIVTHGQWRVSRLTEQGIESAQLNVPSASRFSWTSRPIFQDNNGNLWALSISGLYKFPYQKSLSAQAAQTPQLIAVPDLLGKESSLYRAFSDSQNNVWFSVRGPNQNKLLKLDAKTNQWTDYSQKSGYPQGFSVVSMAEDAAGQLWFSLYGKGGLLRFSNDSFYEITTAHGLPDGAIFALHTDTKGRLWIGSTTNGLARLNDPTAVNLEFAYFTEKDGLTNNNVRCLTEDSFGNIYAGTVRGVSRINPETGQIKQITTADGLAADFVHAAFRDKNGAMWFGTANGLSKFTPTKENEPPVPAIYISNLQIAGETYDISEFGQQTIENLEVAASQNNLRIDFFGIGEAKDLRYQYKFEGTDADWSVPSDQRTVNFANLSSGSYRFLVRAVNNLGVGSPKPAVVSFTIHPPFYRTWWFLALVCSIVGGIVFAFVRYRLRKIREVQAALEALSKSRAERLAELQRVRTRIATDLHDDIGSSLTQISVLSSVARRGVLEKKEVPLEPLESITNVSNELVEAMSDIVWAINPRKDSLRELIFRMRRFASDVLTAQEIDFEFEAPEADDKTRLGANIRREIFAIFKECINNIVRHSGAKNVSVIFELHETEIFIKIADDGHGFDTEKVLSEDFAPDKGGNGLINMRRRAQDLGGICEIISGESGTITTLKIPLAETVSEQGQ